MNGRKIACVVIHHRNIERLPFTIDLIREEGIDIRDILIVDNSEDQVSDEQLDAGARCASVLRVPNQGYGNAANVGIELLLDRADPPEFILVATHEVEPRPGALNALMAVMRDPQRKAVGPALVSTVPGGGTRISLGGGRSKLLGIPRHVTVDDLADLDAGPSRVLDRLWLDGAFVLYRATALRSHRFREEFFLYFEETELHYRLSTECGDVACAPEAVVAEVASGIPARFRGRNLQWLLQLHGKWWQRTCTVPSLILKAGLKTLFRRGNRPSEVIELIKGWRWALRHPIPKDSEPI